MNEVTQRNLTNINPMSTFRILFCTAVVTFISGCGINSIPTLDEKVVTAANQIDNQYKRRADLIPNLVNTVKGFAAQEKETFLAVTNARSRVLGYGSQSIAELSGAELQDYQAAQRDLSTAVRNMMLVVESYPALKSNENFLTLQSQLEGTENRIAVARRDYLLAVEKYNIELRTIPGRWWKNILYPEMQLREIAPLAEPIERKVPVVNF